MTDKYSGMLRHPFAECLLSGNRLAYSSAMMQSSVQVEGSQNREISLFIGNTSGRFFTWTFQDEKPDFITIQLPLYCSFNMVLYRCVAFLLNRDIFIVVSEIARSLAKSGELEALYDEDNVLYVFRGVLTVTLIITPSSTWPRLVTSPTLYRCTVNLKASVTRTSLSRPSRIYKLCEHNTT